MQNWFSLQEIFKCSNKLQHCQQKGHRAGFSRILLSSVECSHQIQYFLVEERNEFTYPTHKAQVLNKKYDLGSSLSSFNLFMWLQRGPIFTIPCIHVLRVLLGTCYGFSSVLMDTKEMSNKIHIHRLLCFFFGRNYKQCIPFFYLLGMLSEVSIENVTCSVQSYICRMYSYISLPFHFPDRFPFQS